MRDAEAGEKTSLLGNGEGGGSNTAKDLLKKIKLSTICCWIVMILLLVFLVIMTAVFTGKKMNNNAEVPDDSFDNVLTKGLGVINFNGISTDDASARGHFLLGLKLLSVFWYDVARMEFKRAQSIDPMFAMAYWGEAMTYKHAVWGWEDLQGAQQALSNITERVYVNTIARERDYIDAARILFAPDASMEDRQRAYTAKMQEMFAVYPEYANVCAFYGLSLLSAARCPDQYLNATEVQDTIERARDTMEGCMQQSGDRGVHPGLLNYLVQAYDTPDIMGNTAMSAKAKNYADKLASVAYLAPTALHLKSRIYARLGLWDEVAESNTDALAARDYYCDNHGVPGDSACLVSIVSTILEWRQYALLQQAKVAEANMLLDTTRSTAIVLGSDVEMYKMWMYRMYAAQQIQTQLFPQVIGLEADARSAISAALPPLSFDMFWAPHAEANALLAKVYGIVMSNSTINQATQITIANLTINGIAMRLGEIQANVSATPGGSETMATLIGSVQMQVRAMQVLYGCWVSGVRASSPECADGPNGWSTYMRSAVDMQAEIAEAIDLPFLQPAPATQTLADMMLATGSNDKDAVIALYANCLDELPNKLNCVVGTARAYKRAYDATRMPEDLEAAKTWYARVRSQSKPANVDQFFPPLVEATAIARAA